MEVADTPAPVEMENGKDEVPADLDGNLCQQFNLVLLTVNFMRWLAFP